MTDRKISFASSNAVAPPTTSSSSPFSHSLHRPPTKAIIPVTPSDVHTAFTFFDINKRGSINIEELKSRLSIFYPTLTHTELTAMMMGKSELTESDLYDLLANHSLTNYDPIAEAFKLYDPSEVGAVDMEVLRHFLLQFGLPDLTKGDLATLLDLSDRDRDGKINLSDFRRLLHQKP